MKANKNSSQPEILITFFFFASFSSIPLTPNRENGSSVSAPQRASMSGNKIFSLLHFPQFHSRRIVKMAVAYRRLKELQSQPGNKICVDCSTKNPQWATVSFGAFLCLECSGKHRGLGVHISFVRSVTMDSWSDIQLRKMDLGGNDNLIRYLASYGIPKETDIVVSKYNTNAASNYRDKIQSLADSKPWRDPPPPIVKQTTTLKPPLSGGGVGNSDWDTWDNFDDVTDNYRNGSSNNNNNMRRYQSVGDFRNGSGRTTGNGGHPGRSKSTDGQFF